MEDVKICRAVSICALREKEEETIQDQKFRDNVLSNYCASHMQLLF